MADDDEVYDFTATDFVDPTDSIAPIKVKLGGKVYTARCPDMLVFLQLADIPQTYGGELGQAQLLRAAGHIGRFLDFCFSVEEAQEIQHRTTISREISFGRDLLPTFTNVIGKFEAEIKKRTTATDMTNVVKPDVK